MTGEKTFPLGPNKAITALTVDSELRIYAGGSFTTFHGSNHNFLVRLNSTGTIDDTFNPPAWNPKLSGSGVSKLILQPDGKILVAGNLNSNLGVVRLNADGSPDDTWQASASSLRLVDMVRQREGSVYAGGRISSTNMGARLLRLQPDGTIDTSYPSISASDSISALLPLDDGRLVVGLRFSSKVAGVTPWVSYLALLPNGDIDSSFGPADPNCFGVAAFRSVDQTSFLVAGIPQFFHLLATNGIINKLFPSPRSDYDIATMALQNDGNILIQGGFTKVNGLSRSKLARLYRAAQVPMPLILGPYLSRDGFECSIPTSTNHVFTLESKDSIDASTWRPVVALPGNDQWQRLRDPGPTSSLRFYRIRAD